MLEYRFELHGNPQFGTLHVSPKLHTGRYSSNITPEVLTPELKQLSAMLASIDGVNCVYGIANHSIWFEVSPLYPVETILGRAVRVFMAWHGTAESQWRKQKTRQPPDYNRY